MSTATAPERRCAVFWTGGHLCLTGTAGHVGDHHCANARCVDVREAPAVWGLDAGELRRGAIPLGGSELQPSRGLTGRAAR